MVCWIVIVMDQDFFVLVVVVYLYDMIDDKLVDNVDVVKEEVVIFLIGLGFIVDQVELIMLIISQMFFVSILDGNCFVLFLVG